MSRKDYVAVAAIFNAELSALSIDGVEKFYPNGEAVERLESAAKSMADYFKRDNSNFDRKRFLDACGFGE